MGARLLVGDPPSFSSSVSRSIRNHARSRSRHYRDSQSRARCRSADRDQEQSRYGRGTTCRAPTLRPYQNHIVTYTTITDSHQHAIRVPLRSITNKSLLCDDHGFHQYVALIMKMLSAGARNIRPIEEPKRKSPLISESSRFCVHTKYSVEPGMYSHRSTALPRSDL